MTKETAKEYLPLVQALAEGKLQERKVIDGLYPNYQFSGPIPEPQEPPTEK